MHRARIPHFHTMTIAQRARALLQRGALTQHDIAALLGQAQVLSAEAADKMVENVIGVFGMPMGLGLNFCINGADVLVPLVVEEPSIIAAVSAAAKVVRQAGGFVTQSDRPRLIGQIHIVDVADAATASAAIAGEQQELLEAANRLHPNMVARGGGACAIEVRTLALPASARHALAVHLVVDTCDAMGANVVNGMCEGIAPRLQALTGGHVRLRILSNLADRAMVEASCCVPAEALGTAAHAGAFVRDAIVEANDLALVDPYRAATHNKGIMNGIDAVALATGNDWRAIEASAHAYAARRGHYAALTAWRCDANGTLVGTLRLPLKVGTVGGNFAVNPAVQLAHALMRHPNSRCLAETMVAVGLAQNLAALRALVTHGIQKGHMALHARAVAASARVPAHLFDAVVARMVAEGRIGAARATRIVAALQNCGADPQAAPPSHAPSPGPTAAERTPTQHQAPASPATAVVRPPPDASTTCTTRACGKILLAGEHAVVYGSHALAMPVPLTMQARIAPTATGQGISVHIPAWHVDGTLSDAQTQSQLSGSLRQSLWRVVERMRLANHSFALHVAAEVPRAMGLGSSAALAVCLVRTLAQHFSLSLTHAEVMDLAMEAEKVAHGHPSGVDVSVATFGQPLLFRRGEPPLVRPVRVRAPIELVVGMGHAESLTAKTVQQVRAAWQRHRALYDGLFANIDILARQAADAISAHDLQSLGELMDVNHGMLAALQVSTPELEAMVALCRRHGAAGAKLTGAGGGGSIVALCPDGHERVMQALQSAGYRVFLARIEATAADVLDVAS